VLPSAPVPLTPLKLAALIWGCRFPTAAPIFLKFRIRIFRFVFAVPGPDDIWKWPTERRSRAHNRPDGADRL